MIHIVATAVATLPVRIFLGVLGALVSWILGPVAILFAIVGVADLEPLVIFLGVGGTLGLLGWWLRVLLPPAIIRSRMQLRRAVLGLLILGTTSATYLAVAFGSPLRWIFVPVALAGVVMVLGTFLAPGPNSPSKPTPV